MSEAETKMRKPILVVDHMDQGADDAGLTHLRDRGVPVIVRRPYLGEALPEVSEISGLMVMGGPQMVTDIDALPWMRAEADLLKAALAARIPTLCICLGAQLLAHTLGGEVGPDPEGRSIYGFHDLRPLPLAPEADPNPISDGLWALSANLQGFSIPEGAEPLATTDGPWRNQAFRYGSALALQFHPEVTRAILDHWHRDYPELNDLPGAQSEAERDKGFAAHDPATKAWFRATLDRLYALA